MNPLQREWWRQAFAIPAPPPWEDESDAARRLVWLAQQVVDRGLAVPAVMLLESVRPLQGGTSRLLPFFEPLWSAFAGESAPCSGTDWTRLLEHPAAVDWLIRQIEQRERVLANAPETSPRRAVPEEPAGVPGHSPVVPQSENVP
jgi:hypothetical protein